MPETEEIRIRKLFREADSKIVFAGELGDPAFLVFYHAEIIALAKDYGITFCIHKPTQK